MEQYIKRGPYATELTGDPVEDGYIVMSNMTNENYRSENVEPEFKDGILSLKVLKGEYGDNYISLSSSLSNTFDGAVKKFGVKKIVVAKNANVAELFIPELVDGVDIEAPDYNVVVFASVGFKGIVTVTNSNIKCRNFIVDFKGRVRFDNINVECTDSYFKIWETNSMSCIKPSCKISANLLSLNNAKSVLLGKLQDMKDNPTPRAFSKLSISKILNLRACGTWNKIVVALERWSGCVVFVRNDATIIGDHGMEYELKDGWKMAFCDHIEDLAR